MLYYGKYIITYQLPKEINMCNKGVWSLIVVCMKLLRVMSNLKISLLNPRPINKIENKVHQIICYKCQNIYLSWTRHRFHCMQVYSDITYSCNTFIWLELCSIISQPNPFRVGSLISKLFGWLKTLNVFICLSGSIARSGGCRLFFPLE